MGSEVTKHGESCFKSDYTPVDGEGEDTLRSTTVAEGNKKVGDVGTERVVRVNATLIDGISVAVVQKAAS